METGGLSRNLGGHRGPREEGELLERIYVNGMKPKKLRRPIPGADRETGRNVTFVFHFTDPCKPEEDIASPDEVEKDHAPAGDGDAAVDLLQNGAPQEEIEGLIRRCGNVVFTHKHEIIDG